MGRVPPVGAHIARPTEVPPPRRWGERPPAVDALRGRRQELGRALSVVTMPVVVTGGAPPKGPPPYRPCAVRARGHCLGGAQRAAERPLLAVAIPILVAAPTAAPRPVPGATGTLAVEARNGRPGALLHGTSLPQCGLPVAWRTPKRAGKSPLLEAAAPARAARLVGRAADDGGAAHAAGRRPRRPHASVGTPCVRRRGAASAPATHAGGIAPGGCLAQQILQAVMERPWRRGDRLVIVETRPRQRVISGIVDRGV